MQSWFIYKGERSIDHGIWVTRLPGVVRAAERAERLTVPGRPGVLTLLEGDDVHDSYIKECVITAKRDANLDRVLEWLTGSGEAVFSNEPDRAYEATIYGTVEFTNISNSLCQANVPFLVHPHKKAVPAEAKITKTLTAETAQSIYNPGDVASRPKIKITRSSSGNMTFKVADVAMSFTSAPTVLVIDCDAHIVLKSDGQVWTGVYSGDFWKIPPGECEIECNKACTVEIEPRWRWK